MPRQKSREDSDKVPIYPLAGSTDARSYGRWLFVSSDIFSSEADVTEVTTGTQCKVMNFAYPEPSGAPCVAPFFIAQKRSSAFLRQTLKPCPNRAIPNRQGVTTCFR